VGFVVDEVALGQVFSEYVGYPYTMGTGGYFPGAKRPVPEADHSPPNSAEVRKMWIYTSIPHKSSWRSA
jgi:hypothetical protein